MILSYNVSLHGLVFTLRRTKWVFQPLDVTFFGPPDPTEALPLNASGGHSYCPSQTKILDSPLF